MTATQTNLLYGRNFMGEDFSGRDLSGQNLSNSVFENCRFDGCDMTRADCEGSRFPGTSFRGTILSYVNFRNAQLETSIFEPADAFGITLTMDCRTFRNMHVGKMWWLSMQMLISQMALPVDPGAEDLQGKLIDMIGPVRYTKLKALFDRRSF